MWHYMSHATELCLPDEGCAQWMKHACNAHYASHVTRLCMMDKGYAQWKKHARNAQTCTANTKENKYHVRTCKTYKCHVQCISNEHTCNMTMPDD